MRATIASACAAALLACATRAGSPAQDPAAVRRAIDQGNARYVEAYRRGDAAALAAVYAADRASLAPGGRVIRGRPALEAAKRAMFARHGPADAQIVTLDVWLLHGLAYETGRYVFTFPPAGSRRGGARGATSVDSGAYVTVWKREPDGMWRIWADLAVP